MHRMSICIIHHVDFKITFLYPIYFSNAVYPCVFFVFLFLFLPLRTQKWLLRKPPLKVSKSTSSSKVFDSTRFHSFKNFEIYDTLIKFRSIWSERNVNLDELVPFVQQNLESRGWLSICSDLVSPPTTIIREFYSNMSIHFVATGGHFLTTWIKGGDEYRITKKVMVDALTVPTVYHPTYPYTDPPFLSDVMSLLCGKPMTWEDEPRLESSELNEENYLLFRIACNSICHISHIHMITIYRCIFLYALVTSASMCLPSLFIQTIANVNRNTFKKHDLFFPVSIIRILEYQGFKCTSSSELVSQIAPIGATILKQS